MSKQGIQSLGDFQIGASAIQVGDWVTGFDRLLALTVQLRLAYGSGGTAIKAYLQTSLDQGETAIDIACVTFGQTSKVAILNFSRLTPKLSQITPSDGALTDDTAIDGVLGDRFRLKVASSGTYAGSTTLSVRASPL